MLQCILGVGVGLVWSMKSFRDAGSFYLVVDDLLWNQSFTLCFLCLTSRLEKEEYLIDTMVTLGSRPGRYQHPLYSQSVGQNQCHNSSRCRGLDKVVQNVLKDKNS